jgi:ketosteroid isomerase-like protein
MRPTLAALVALLALLVLRPIAAAPSEVETLQLTWDVAAAEVRGDAAFLDRAWAPEFTVTSQFGRVSTKAEQLAIVRSGANRFESIEVTDARARLYGDTAVVTQQLRLRGQVAGTPVDGAVRALSVCVKRDGRWQVVATQYTRVQAP